MTAGSTITDPGVVSNTIDSAAVTFTASCDPGNYSARYQQGELKVTAATMGIAAFPAEKFYDAEPTNVTWVVTSQNQSQSFDKCIVGQDRLDVAQ